MRVEFYGKKTELVRDMSRPACAKLLKVIEPPVTEPRTKKRGGAV